MQVVDNRPFDTRGRREAASACRAWRDRFSRAGGSLVDAEQVAEERYGRMSSDVHSVLISDDGENLSFYLDLSDGSTASVYVSFADLHGPARAALQ